MCTFVGECSRLGLTGRCAGLGLLATSTLYRYADKICCFPPEVSVAAWKKGEGGEEGRGGQRGG